MIYQYFGYLMFKDTLLVYTYYNRSISDFQHSYLFLSRREKEILLCCSWILKFMFSIKINRTTELKIYAPLFFFGCCCSTPEKLKPSNIYFYKKAFFSFAILIFKDLQLTLTYFDFISML